MINLIRSEFYKAIHNKGLRIFIVIMVLLSSAVVLINAYYGYSDPEFNYANTAFIFSILSESVAGIFFIVLIVLATVDGDEYKEHTIKHSIGFGISRTGIYVCRQLVGLIVALILFIVIVMLYIGLAYLTLKHSNVGELNSLMRSIIAGIPLYIAVYSIGYSMFINLNNNTKAMFFTMGIIILPHLINEILSSKYAICRQLSDWILYTMAQPSYAMVNNAVTRVFTWDTYWGIARCYIVGIAVALVFNIIGIMIFKRKEIR